MEHKARAKKTGVRFESKDTLLRIGTISQILPSGILFIPLLLLHPLPSHLRVPLT